MSQAVDPVSETGLYTDALRFASEIVRNESDELTYLINPTARNPQFLSLPADDQPLEDWVLVGPTRYPLNARIRMATAVLRWQGDVGSEEEREAIKAEVRELFTELKISKPA